MAQAQCENGCTLTVHAERDGPNEPIYPVVVCHRCMTRWFGHREDRDSRPLDPRLPAALRDAIILDQADRAFEILEELGYKQTVRPNACVGCCMNEALEPAQTAQIVVRPQCEEFTPTHFVTDVGGFLINDIRVGTRSQFIAFGNIPSEAFRMNASGQLIFRPGQDIGSAHLDIPEPARSACRWPARPSSGIDASPRWTSPLSSRTCLVHARSSAHGFSACSIRVLACGLDAALGSLTRCSRRRKFALAEPRV